MYLPNTDDANLGGLKPGALLGRYELLMPVGVGQVAVVWAARLQGSRGFQKVVAIKTILPKLRDDPRFERIFLTEARLASEVRHPHVIQVVDLGEQDGLLFLAMEWLDGIPVSHLIREARSRYAKIPRSVAVRIAMQACAGLHAAHELVGQDGKSLGLVHRDVSPQKLLVTSTGVTKIVDFGLAKATASLGETTATAQLKRSFAYMAPEQFRGEPVDRRTDVFALGAVLYVLTTGVEPFRTDSEAATALRIASSQPVTPPSQFVRFFPTDLEQVLLRALEKDPDRRFATAEELMGALAHTQVGSGSGAGEEVASFVRSLIGHVIEERRHALDEALQAASQSGAATARADWALDAGPREPLPAFPLEESSAPTTSPMGRGFHGASPSALPPSAGDDSGTTRSRIAILGCAVLAIAAAMLIRPSRHATTNSVPAASSEPPNVASGSSTSGSGSLRSTPAAGDRAEKTSPPKAEGIKIDELPIASAQPIQPGRQPPRLRNRPARSPANQRSAPGSRGTPEVRDPGF